MPACRFSPLDKLTVFSSTYQTDSEMIAVNSIPALLARSISDHQSRGDLDAAWADLVVMLQSHASGPARYPLNEAFAALSCERRRFESCHGLGG